MKISNRSTKRGSSAIGLASGEISTGWPKTSVGWIKSFSTVTSKALTSASPTLGCGSLDAQGRQSRVGLVRRLDVAKIHARFFLAPRRPC